MKSRKKFPSSPNLMEYCVFYRDKDLPQSNHKKATHFRNSLIQDSLMDSDHPLNQLVRKSRVFVPYLNERDDMGKLYSPKSTVSARASNFLGSKNSVSHSNSIITQTTQKFRLGNLLGMTLDHTHELPKIPSQFKLTQFSPNISVRDYKKPIIQKSVHEVTQTPSVKLPHTPQALKIYKSQLIIQRFLEGKIPRQLDPYINIFECIFKAQKNLLSSRNSMERRRTKCKGVKLSWLLLIPRQSQYSIIQ